MDFDYLNLGMVGGDYGESPDSPVTGYVGVGQGLMGFSAFNAKPPGQSLPDSRTLSEQPEYQNPIGVGGINLNFKQSDYATSTNNAKDAMANGTTPYDPRIAMGVNWDKIVLPNGTVKSTALSASEHDALVKQANPGMSDYLDEIGVQAGKVLPKIGTGIGLLTLLAVGIAVFILVKK